MRSYLLLIYLLLLYASKVHPNHVIRSDGSDNIEFQTDGGTKRGEVTTSTGSLSWLFNIFIDNQKEIRFYELDANGSNYIAFKAPAALSGDVTFTLPDADGEDGQALITNGSGVISWGEAGGGDAGFDYAFTYDGDSDDYSDTTDFEANNNSTFGGGSGALVGTLSLDTTSANLLDADNNTKVIKYLAGASDETNDYVQWPVITIPQSVRNAGDSSYQSILVTMWYWHNFPSSALDFKAECISGSEAGVISQSSRSTKIVPTDWDDDNAKDVDEGDFLFNGAGIAFNVHADCATIRVGVQVSEDLTSGEFLLMDRVKVGVLPNNAVDVSNDTSWVSYTPSATGFGTISSTIGRWRRVGDSMEVHATFDSGIPTAVDATIELPSGYEIDLTKVNGSSNGGLSGHWYRARNTVSYGDGGLSGPLFSDASDVDSIFFSYRAAASGTMEKSDGNTIAASGELMAVNFTVPISGWSANNKKIIVPSADSNMPKVHGYVEWIGDDFGDTACDFVTSVTAGTITNYTADADCDDVPRNCDGDHNTTDCTAGGSDGQTPKIKFDEVGAGTLRCEARGTFYYQTANYWYHRFTDGTNHTTLQGNYQSTSGIGTGVITGEFHYDTKQTDVTIQLQVQSSSSANEYIQVRNDRHSDFKIICWHFPKADARINYLIPTVGYSWENSLAAFIANSGTPSVTSQNVDFIDSLTDNGVGDTTVTFETNYFSVTPSCRCTIDANLRSCAIASASTSSIRVYTGYANTGANEDHDFFLQCERQGSDYRKLGDSAAIIAQPECVLKQLHDANTAGQTWATSWDDLKFDDTAWGKCWFLTKGTPTAGGTFYSNNYITTFTVNPGCYKFQGSQGYYSHTTNQKFGIRLYNETDSTAYVQAQGTHATSNVTTKSRGHIPILVPELCFAGATELSLEGIAATNTNGQWSEGNATGISTYDEHGVLSITKVK